MSFTAIADKSGTFLFFFKKNNNCRTEKSFVIQNRPFERQFFFLFDEMKTFFYFDNFEQR